MVDFTLTDEQRAMQEMAHEFAEKEIRPVAWEYDKEGTWPQDIIDKAWELGLMNGHLPEEYGAVIVRHNLVPRLGIGEDIASLVVYLGSDESGYVTGQCLTVDGGFFAHGPTWAEMSENDAPRPV